MQPIQHPHQRLFAGQRQIGRGPDARPFQPITELLGSGGFADLTGTRDDLNQRWLTPASCREFVDQRTNEAMPQA